MKKIKSLRHKLLSIILFSALLTIGVFAVISQFRLSQSIRGNLKQQMENGLERSNQRLDMVMDKYNVILYDLCTNDSILSLVEKINRSQDDMGVNSSLIRRELSHVCNRNTGVKGIIIETVNGKRIFYDSLSHSSLKSQWMDQVTIPDVKMREEYQWLSQPVTLGNQEVYLFQIGRRLVDYEDIHKKIGTAVILVDADMVRQVIDSGPGSRVYLCEGDRIVSGPSEEEVGRNISDLYGNGWIVGKAYNEMTGWSIDRAQSLKGYYRTMTEQILFQLFIALCTIVTLMLIVHYSSRPILQSVDTVVQAMSQAEGGDFSVQIPLNKRMSDEVLRIAGGFNEMIGQIAFLVNQNRQAALEQKNAELSALEAQIDPHFLYNTLDTINWKAIENEQYEISEMLGALADILRYVVRDAGAETTIRQEISWLNQYLLLYGARLGKKLRQELSIEEDVWNCKIHKLMLQPFIENSIKHGLMKKEGQCRIRLIMKVVGEQLHIIIEDNGKGMDGVTLQKLNSGKWDAGNHLGIANVRKRMNLYYSDEAGLYFESKAGRYTRVHLLIPARKEGGS